MDACIAESIRNAEQTTFQRLTRVSRLYRTLLKASEYMTQNGVTGIYLSSGAVLAIRFNLMN
jgi:hypothetical protein